MNVVLSTKISATSGLVNIISYDLVSKMAKELQAKKFMAVIAVSVNVNVCDYKFADYITVIAENNIILVSWAST